MYSLESNTSPYLAKNTSFYSLLMYQFISIVVVLAYINILSDPRNVVTWGNLNTFLNSFGRTTPILMGLVKDQHTAYV